MNVGKQHAAVISVRRRAQMAALAMRVGLTASLPVGAALAPRAAAGQPCVDGWQPMSMESSLAGGGPAAATALGGEPGWMVGRRLARPMIGRWDGSLWRNVSSPWTTDAGLTGVSALSPSIAWTAGYGRLFSPRAISARWTGTAWQAISVPHPGGTMATFTDVVALASKRAFAVGVRLAKGRLHPVAMFRTKTAWVNRSPLFPAAAEGALTAAAQASDGTLWAVGWRADSGRPAPWIGFWDGAAWNETPTEGAGGGLAYLTDINFRSPTDGWAVGYVERDGGGYGSIIQHWDGSAWSSQTLPWDPATPIVLTGVGLGTDGVVVVAGQSIGDAGPSAVFATNDAGTWHVTLPRDDPYPGSWSEDAAGSVRADSWSANSQALARPSSVATSIPRSHQQ